MGAMKTKIMKLEMEMISGFEFHPLARLAHVGKYRDPGKTLGSEMLRASRSGTKR